MAILPTPADIQRQTPRSRMSIPNISAGPDERAQIDLGRTVAKVGGVIAEVADYRATIQAEDAMNQLAMADNELQAKLQTIKNGDAANQDLLGNFTKERESRIKAIKDGMKNPAAIGKFDSGVAKTAPRFGATVLQHQISEAASYRLVVDKAGLETDTSTIALNHTNEGLVNDTLEAMRKKSEQVAETMGITDLETRNVFKQARLGQAHYAFVNSAIQSGDITAATKHLEKNKGEMTLEQIEKAKKLIGVESDNKIVDEVWMSLGPKTGNDPVRMFDMESKIREKMGENPVAIKAAIAEVRSRAAGFNSQQAEVKASNISFVMDMYNSGTSLMNIRKSQQFIELPGDEQTRIIEHILDRGYTQQQRTKADEDKKNNPDAQAIYWGIRDSSQIDTLSDNQILALQPHIGTHLVDSLMQERARPDRVSAIALDNQIIKDAYLEAGGKPDSKSPDDKAAMTRLALATKQRIDQIQRDTNKKLTFEEKQKIASEEADRKVIKETWFGLSSAEVPLVKVGKAERTKVITPIEQIPQDQISGLVNIMRSRGKIEAWVTDDAAKAKYKNNIQKAYGRYQAGGSQQEILDALDGQ